MRYDLCTLRRYFHGIHIYTRSQALPACKKNLKDGIDPGFHLGGRGGHFPPLESFVPPPPPKIFHMCNHVHNPVRRSSIDRMKHVSLDPSSKPRLHELHSTATYSSPSPLSRLPPSASTALPRHPLPLHSRYHHPAVLQRQFLHLSLQLKPAQRAREPVQPLTGNGLPRTHIFIYRRVHRKRLMHKTVPIPTCSFVPRLPWVEAVYRASDRLVDTCIYPYWMGSRPISDKSVLYLATHELVHQVDKTAHAWSGEACHWNCGNSG